MKLDAKRLINQVIAVTALLCMTMQPTLAALLNLSQAPLFIGANIPPQVMLNIAKDHQLHYKAYTDYSDLDDDGVLDITYKHSIDYYGYFDSYKCYTYSTVNGRFEPAAVTVDKYCTPGASQWGGNFLNWVSMTRLDSVRKLLFGGLRSTDTATLTVLERSYLPPDAHAFSKYYGGLDANGVRDIHKLTPFDAEIQTAITSTTSATSRTIGAGSHLFAVAAVANLARLTIGDAIRVTATSGAAAPGGGAMIGRVTTISGSNVTIDVDATGITGAGQGTGWTVVNLSQTGISFCNVTMGTTSGANQLSHTNTNPPLLKAARGNFSLWNSMERFQCLWNEDTSSPVKGSAFVETRWNGNIPSASGIFSNAGEPTTATHRVGGTDFIVRVEACRSTLLGAERCKQYPSGNYKPIGLLQEYGDTNLIHFGLMTGSYAKNISGGVLRKNPGSLTNEINVATNGTFTTPPAAGHVIGTLSRLRLYGFNYDQGVYDGGGDTCPPYTATGGSAAGSRSVFTEGNCSNWGNPMSEIYLESLRYLAGAAADPAFTYTSAGSKDAALGLPLATWVDPLNTNNYCSSLNVLNFNAAVSSFDGDQFSGTSSLAGAPNATTTTNAVGYQEGFDNRSFFIGKIIGAGATLPAASDFEVCTGKNVPTLGQARGICSEAPALEGSYLMSGLAHYARTNRIRTNIATVPAADTKSLKVTTYGITLASNIPLVKLKNPANLSQTIATILPTYRPQDTSNPAGAGSGAMVDFKVVPGSLVPATGPATGTERGAYYVNWDVSQHGGDYDTDAWGVIRYCVKTAANTCSNLTATSETVGNVTITTDLVFTAASGFHGFGYIIGGTSRDGAHYHSGGSNFNYTYTAPNGAQTVECNNCNSLQSPTSQTYTPVATPSAGAFPDPLHLAAKYGSFVDSNGNNMPDLQSEWDSKLANGVPGQDGIPDNYFLVTNPMGLEAALDRAFITILSNSSASSVATNSTSMQTGTTIYQARFNSNDWSGQVLAFPVNLDGTISTTPTWDAGQVVNGQNFNTGRVILTYNTDPASRDGVAFRWPSNPASPGPGDIPLPLVTALNTAPTTSVNDGRGQQRLNYLRGDPSQEGATVTAFRQRPTSKLGDIVNSNPTFVGAPRAGLGEASYSTFRLAHANRTPMIYVGGNDGMLHGFRASDGQELLAYVPSKTHAQLNQLTSKTYTHRYSVDGSPQVGDAYVGAQWRSVLVGGLGAGGQGLFALDITDPTLFTEANAAATVLWEFNDIDDPDLGYVIGQPSIRKMANGRWAAIVSGGYNNSEADWAVGAGTAVLFIIFLDGPSGPNRTWVSGTDYIKISTGTGSAATPNGLGEPFPADINADGMVDFVYAGDQRGDLWKFDLRDASPATWTAATRRVKLFSAKDAANNPQPITAKVEGTPHPTGQGYMIVFGTGKYLEPTDPQGPYLAQTFYGVWDKNDGATVSVQTTVSSRGQLLQQTINDVVVGTSTFRVVSTSQPNWSQDSTPPTADDSPVRHMGWYMDFPSSTTTGERSVFRPILTSGRLIFTTLVPSTQTCLFGGTSFMMVVDPATGARNDSVVLDVNANGVLDNSDQVSFGGLNVYASGVQSTIGITPTPTIIRGDPGASSGSSSAIGQTYGTTAPTVAGFGSLMAYAIAAGSSGSNASTIVGLSTSGGRVSWRELLTD